MASGSNRAPPPPTYTMGGDHSNAAASYGARKHHRRGGSTQEDDNGSLTYSAGSSIHSGGSSTSAAGESTDSSFAEIMRVLDMQESKELATLIKKEEQQQHSRHRQHQQHQHHHKAAKKTSGSVGSAGSSLNYSTDGDSAISGDTHLQTITGQPSDSYGPDGGGLGLVQEEQDQGLPQQAQEQHASNIVFAPADPVNDNIKAAKSNMKGRSPRKKQPRKSMTVPSPPSTPPLPRKEAVDASAYLEESSHRLATEGEGTEVWYAKWWMCGFQDAFRDLVPKR